MHIFSGIHKNRTLQSAQGSLTRPTSGRLRETLFNICQHFVEESRFLVLFAGSGAMGLEALSRGAKQATFIDNSKESIRCIQANARAIKEEGRSKIIQGDVFDQIKRLAKDKCQFDIIYADPPYENLNQTEGGTFYYSEILLKFIDEQLANEVPIIAPGGVFFLEEAANISLEKIPLCHLKLKNKRSTGRAALHYYIFSE